MTTVWGFLVTCAVFALVGVVALIVLAAAAVGVLWVIAGVSGYLADRRREKRFAAEWRAVHPALAPRDRHGRRVDQ